MSSGISSRSHHLGPEPQYLDLYVQQLRKDIEASLLRNRPRRSINRTVIIPTLAKPRDDLGSSRLAVDLPEFYNHFILVGEGGTGKTTVLREMTLLAADSYLSRDVNAQLPVYLTLNQITESIHSLIEDTLKVAGISSKALQRYFLQSRLFLVFDGLNEIPENKREQSLEEIIHLIERYKQNHFVISTRPPLPINDLGLRVFDLQPLTEDQIINYVKGCIGNDPESTERFLRQMGVKEEEQWETPRSLITLVRNPMTLSWMVEVGVSERQNRGWLIEDLMRHRLKDGNSTSYSQKIAALRELAYQMIDEKNTTTYTPWSRVERVLSESPLLDTDNSRFHEILAGDVLQPSGEGVIWMHQLVQEFFGALAIETRLQTGASLEHYVRNLKWHEPLVLLSSLLDNSDTFLQAITALDPFLGARCYCSAETLANRNTLRDQLIKVLVKERTNLWALTGDYWQVEQMIKEEAERNATMGLYQLLGKLIETQLRYEEALAIFEASALLEGVAPAEQFEQLCNTGNIHRRYGRHQDALRLFVKAEEIAHTNAYYDRDDWLYYELAYVYEKEGNIRQALNYYNRSFQAAMTAGQTGRAHIAMAQAACMLSRSGHYRIAERLLQRSLKAFETEPQANVRWIANAEVHLIEVYIGLGDFVLAKQMIDRIQSGASPFHIRHGKSTYDFLFKVGRYYLRQGLYKEALTSLIKAVELSNNFAETSRDRVAELFYEMGQAYLGLGDEEEAIRFFNQSLKERIDLMNSWGHAHSYLALGQLALHSGGMEEARQYLEQSLILFLRVHSTQLPLVEKLQFSLANSKVER